MRATIWLAQLTEPVIEISPGRFNVDRPTCRYFVRTEALAGYPHALEWWQQRGQDLRLADEAAAIARAAASDGVHFSFEKIDRVTRSTICGRVEPASMLEHITWRNQLVSFAIPELALASARELVSGIGPQAEEAANESQGDEEGTASLAPAELAAVVAAASDERALRLAQKRERGYQEQLKKKEERDQKRQ